jgi:hypothetical protein
MRLFTLFLFLTFLAQGYMTSQENTRFLRDLSERYDAFKVPSIESRRFTQEEFFSWIAPAVTSGTFSSEQVGSSSEGRPLMLYRFGSGPVSIFLWSQMHGDESTATMALADIFSFFHTQPDHPIVATIKKNISLYVLPMVNPDGAARFQRRTSENIDINRDALRLATPEARALKETRDRLKPDFGFNLHDQDPRYTVGTSKKMTAIALLAPATDASRVFNETRSRARRLASSITGLLASYIPGHIAKWDDTFEPRAFGDNIQKWGTSTVLIESGGWKDDPEKMHLRKLNVLALVWSCLVVGDGSYEQTSDDAYDDLPFNMRLGFDLLVENARFKHPESGDVVTVDVGLNKQYSYDSASRTVSEKWSVEDIGDLSTHTAYTHIDMKQSIIDSSIMSLEKIFTPEKLKTLIPLK